MNDVVATSEESFYFSNMFHYSNVFLTHLEMFMKWGDIMYYDGSRYKVAASGIALPNGMAMSEDEK